MAQQPRLDVRRALSGGVEMRSWTHVGGARTAAKAEHPTYEVSWTDKGFVSMGIGRREHEMSRGSFMLVPPGVEHETRFVGDVACSSFHLRSDAVEEVESLMRGTERPLIEPTRLSGGTRLATLVSLLWEEGHAEEPDAVHAIAEALVIELLRSVERASGPATATHDPRLRRALELARAGSEKTVRVADLANAAGMSPFHFARSFRDAFGTSPYRFLLRRRLEAAAKLLRAPGVTVTEAALSSGFGDLSRFARMFRREFGCTPSQWVAARRGRRAR